jgi:hypothetical protein
LQGVADAAREEAKRRRAAEKRAKESLKKDAAKLKALSKKVRAYYSAPSDRTGRLSCPHEGPLPRESAWLSAGRGCEAQDEAARKQQEDVAARRADALAERRRLGDAIVVPSFVDARTPEAAARAEAKSEREAVRQQGWDAQEAGWTKDELRDYYKAGRSKPKGKTPVRESRQFGDL